ncbi:MAG: hypothetical protein HYV09_32740 [Deltaproteobacteria bacterium]|nr:hypothetical protein [Deltaproteobacteria bacterium]
MESVVYPLPKPLVATTQVRSTLLCASMQSLRARGHFDAYLAELTEEQRAQAIAMTAGSWLPVQSAMVHYLACDRVVMSRDERLEIGAEVARRIQQSPLHVLVRLSREAGASPWSVLAYAEKLRAQSWQGGGVQILKTGPKDMRLVWQLQPCARSTHFRAGFAGIVKGLFELFCRRAYVSEETAHCTDTTLAIAGSWA